MKKGVNKRGQQTMSLPFGLIFAILMIVMFIVIAFIAVNYFLDLGKCAGVGRFYEDLQLKVDEAWRAQSSDFKFKINVPSGIKRVCFANLSATITNQEDYLELERFDVYEANTFLLPSEKTCQMAYKLIKHINVSIITSSKNPYCVDVKEELRIKKDFYDKLVIIS